MFKKKKMELVNPHLSLITLNVNGFKFSNQNAQDS